MKNPFHKFCVKMKTHNKSKTSQPRTNPMTTPNTPPRFVIMKKSISTLCCCLVCALALSSTGCMAILKIFSYDYILNHENHYLADPRFSATKLEHEYMQASFPVLTWSDNGPQEGLPFILFPFFFVDLPFTFIAEIIMYPIDHYLYYSEAMTPVREENEKAESKRYWLKVIDDNKNVTRGKALRYIVYISELQGWHWDRYYHKITPKDVNIILDASTKKNVYTHFLYLANVPRLHADQYWQIYNAKTNLSDDDAKRLINNLVKNPSTPEEILLDIKNNNFISNPVEKQPEE